VENDLDFCRRRALNFARRAVYSRDEKKRKALAVMAQRWADLARAVARVEPLSAEFRLAAETPHPSMANDGKASPKATPFFGSS
jgi:hypothetical protein